MKVLKTVKTFFSAFLPKAMNNRILMAGLLTSQGKSAFSPQKGQWQRMDFHFLYCYKDLGYSCGDSFGFTPNSLLIPSAWLRIGNHKSAQTYVKNSIQKTFEKIKLLEMDAAMVYFELKIKSYLFFFIKK